MTDLVESDIEEQEDTLNDRFITFLIDKQMYGIEIRYVTEIIGIQQFTEMPDSPDYIKGIINLRGKIIPVMDMALRFSKEPKEYDDRTCIIVADISGMSVGLIVDSVSEVVAIEQENIVDVIDAMGMNNRHVKSVGKIGGNIILLLDCSKLLTEEEIDTLTEIL
jgi:purine-binding chemotaxis protein CheW